MTGQFPFLHPLLPRREGSGGAGISRGAVVPPHHFPHLPACSAGRGNGSWAGISSGISNSSIWHLSHLSISHGGATNSGFPPLPLFAWSTVQLRLTPASVPSSTQLLSTGKTLLIPPHFYFAHFFQKMGRESLQVPQKNALYLNLD